MEKTYVLLNTIGTIIHTTLSLKEATDMKIKNNYHIETVQHSDPAFASIVAKMQFFDIYSETYTLH